MCKAGMTAPGVPGAWGGAPQTDKAIACGQCARHSADRPPVVPGRARDQGHAAAAAGPDPQGRRASAGQAGRPSSHRPARRPLTSRAGAGRPRPRRPEVSPGPSPPGRVHFRAALGARRTATSVATTLVMGVHAAELRFGRVVHESGRRRGGPGLHQFPLSVRTWSP